MAEIIRGDSASPYEMVAAEAAQRRRAMQDFLDAHHNQIVVETPFHFIAKEEVPVDEDYVEELVHDMDDQAAARGGTGQQVSILLGHIDGEHILYEIDGFHREACMRRRGQPTVLSTILEHCTPAEILDRRIACALRPSITFARTVEWVQLAWSRTDWSKLVTAQGELFTVQKAITMTANDTNGKSLHLPGERRLSKQSKHGARIGAGRGGLSRLR